MKSQRVVSPSDMESRLNQILVPIDYSAPAHHALKYAVPLAEAFGAGLHLLVVVEPVSFISGLEQIPIIVLDDPEVAREAHRELQELAEREIPPEIKTTLSVRTGKPSQVIVETAANSGVDLILLSTHGRTGLKRVLLGSTAEQVMRHAPCPVLVYRERVLDQLEEHQIAPSANMKHIVVPVDFSEPSVRAVRYAIGFAHRMNGRLTLLHAVQPIATATRVALDFERLNRQALHHARTELTELAAREINGAIPTSTRVVAGVPFDQITRVAKKIEADLIVIATHGRRGFKRALLGSTAENVVRHAPCPVLVVREPKRRAANGKSARESAPALPLPL